MVNYSLFECGKWLMRIFPFEAEKRENILTDHLKERTEDLNQLEAEFGQEERRLEKEIISLKIQLEEAKRTRRSHEDSDDEERRRG
jgi:hypothetical protein